MKKIMIILILLLGIACAQSKAKKQVVEVACGQCQFGLTTQKGCDLAVRVDGKAYFVDGADIDQFGDAHDEKTGFCEVIRKAEVIGELKDNRFEVNSIKLMEE
ncbi:MAG: hypothetical protein KDC68_02825 [Gelidibacter sp.]|nr:hypothetical protein [Gelidibacter sp.]